MTKYNPDLANSRGQMHVLFILKHCVGKCGFKINGYLVLEYSVLTLQSQKKKQLDGKVVKVIVRFMCLQVFYASFIVFFPSQLKSNWAECIV